MSSVRMSASAKVSAAMGSGKAKVEFSRSVKIDSKDLNISAYARALNGAEFVAPKGAADGDQAIIGNEVFKGQVVAVVRASTAGGHIALTEQAVKYAKEDIAQFRRVCGDGYVAIIFGGSELNGILKIQTDSREENEKLSTSISGSNAAASLSASTERSLKKLEMQHRLSMRFTQIGTGGGPLPLTVEELKSKLKGVAADAIAHPKPISMVVHRYEDLPNWPDGRLEQYESKSESIAESLIRLNSAYDRLGDAIDAPSDFVLGASIKLKNVKQTQDSVQQAVATLKTRLSICAKSALDENCRVDDISQFQDYKYRVSLPLRAVASATQTEIRAKVSKLEKSEKALLKALEDWNKKPADYNVITLSYCDFYFTTRDEVNRRKKSVERQRSELIQFASKIDQTIAQEMKKQNIADVNRLRCDPDPSPPQCLSQQEVDKLGEEIALKTRGLSSELIAAVQNRVAIPALENKRKCRR
ncbi:hypothetical protein [Rhizobium leguminosarum]